MKIIRIIAQIFILWIFYFIGQVIVNWTGLFIPSSIIGLLLLWICLMSGIIKVEYIKGGASFMILYLTLFYIPATVGLIEYPELLRLEGILLMVAIFISSAVTLVITGKASQFIENKEGEKIKGGNYANLNNH